MSTISPRRDRTRSWRSGWRSCRQMDPRILCLPSWVTKSIGATRRRSTTLMSRSTLPASEPFWSWSAPRRARTSTYLFCYSGPVQYCGRNGGEEARWGADNDRRTEGYGEEGQEEEIWLLLIDLFIWSISNQITSSPLQTAKTSRMNVRKARMISATNMILFCRQVILPVLVWVS